MPIVLLVPSLLHAQSPKVSVAPWNNHPAALSLAFDDALEVHLDVAAPALDKRHLRASFFLTVDQITRMRDWKKLLDEGHELGNHSVTHELPDGLTEEGDKIQVLQAKFFLENNFGSPMLDYAYPFGAYNDKLRAYVEQTSFIARTVVGENYFIASDGPVDWFGIPAHEAGLVCDEDTTKPCDEAVYRDWIDTAITKHAWTTVLMHGIGDPSTGYNPIPIKMLDFLLDYASGMKSALWIAPFKEVGAYLRGQKLFEDAKITNDGSVATYHWELAANMPQGTVVKMIISSPGAWIVTQNGEIVGADPNGMYPISLDLKEMTVAPLRSNH